MAAPVASKIILPLDTGNTGKYVRSQTRTVGGETVHEHFFIPTSERSIVGNYKFSSGVLTVPTTAHNGTTTGFIWLYNPVGSLIKMSLKRISYKVNFTALAVDLLVGELRASLFTLVGTGSAGQITPGKRKSTDATPVGNLRTASTGLTNTLGAALHANMYPTMDLATGGAGHWNQQSSEYNPDSEGEEIVLAAGEGLVIWHAAAVTAANRRLIIDGAWDEFE